MKKENVINKKSIHISSSDVFFKKIIFSNDRTKIYEGEYNNKKCIIKSYLCEKDISNKCIREITSLINNKSLNIIELYGIFYDVNYINLVLEYGEYDITKCFNIDINKFNNDILNGLNCLQQNNYIHGDLTFKNIVFVDGSYKLIDFGNSIKYYRRSSLMTPTNYIKPIEMSHNQNNIEISKIDVWAYGVLNYYMGNNIYNAILTNQHNRKSINEIYNEKINNITIEKFYNYYDKIMTWDYYYRISVVNSLLNICIDKNIPIESLFITIKLINKLNNNNIITILILFFEVSKLITNINIYFLDRINIIKSTNNDINERKYKIIFFDICNKLNWDLDVKTFIDYVHSDKNIRIKIIYALILLFDQKYDMYNGFQFKKILENKNLIFNDMIVVCNNSECYTKICEYSSYIGVNFFDLFNISL